MVTVVAQFAGTQEVIQANRFQTDKEAMQTLVDDGSCTYLKTPAGIFTEVTLPFDEIEADHIAIGDTLNSVKITFTRYNESSNNSVYKMGIPKKILMVHKKEMYSFFEKNSIPDNKTSYLTSYDKSYNTYTFNNISQLITSCIKERQDKGEEDEDWNKVVLIPVVTTEDSYGSVVSVRHDLQLNSARLMGGNNEGNSLQVKTVYSKFNH